MAKPKSNPFSIEQTEDSNVSPASMDEPFEVNLDDEEEEGSELETEAAPGVTKGPSRDEKKRNRFAEMKAESERKVAEAEQRARDAEERARRNEAEALAARAAAQYAPKQDAKDELKEAVDRTYRERSQLAELFEQKRASKTLTSEEYAQMQRRDQELDIEQKRLVTRMELRDRGIQPGAGSHDPQREMQIAQMAQIRSHYPDVLANPAAANYAGALHALRRAENPGADNWDMVHQVMEETREKFGIGGKKPTEGSKRKLMGAPTGAQASKEAEPVRKVVMGPAQQRLADKLYAHIEDPKERYKMWAKGPGRRAAAARSA